MRTLKPTGALSSSSYTKIITRSIWTMSSTPAAASIAANWGSDGMYPLDVARNDQGQIVAMQVIFIDASYSDDDEPDTCSECGAEYEPDGSCTYCEHFEASKVED